jgi:hypothetical protein
MGINKKVMAKPVLGIQPGELKYSIILYLGYMKLNKYRIPRMNMLMKYAQVNIL